MNPAAEEDARHAARRGQELHRQRNDSGAVKAYREALRGGFRTVGVYFNLGSLLARHGRGKQAARVLREGLKHYGNDQRLLGEYFINLLELPGITGLAKAHEHFRRVRQVYPSTLPRPPFANHGRFRIGCVSPAFREHPGAFLLYRHFRHLDRSRFELYFFSTGFTDDAYTAEARETADHWREAAGLPAGQVAEMVRRDEIDLLLDATGHFTYSPLPVLALRPAPLQVSFPGYPATTALPAIDFKIVDAVTDPAPADPLYTEKLYRMNGPYVCYAPSPTSPPVAPQPFERNGYVTFGCFNRRSKINERAMALWAEIMNRTPGSRLLFHHSLGANREVSREIRDPIVRFFRRRGVPSGRLQFIGRYPVDEHLAQVSEADIALDTFPYAGSTTTLDCLWMGVPVVTLAGDAHVSRTAASMLTCLGLHEWIAESPEQYVGHAVRHAHDREGLAKLREGLRSRFAASPLMDSKGYMRALETAFLEMWKAVGGPERPSSLSA